MSECYVYRIFDADERLLYVGCSGKVSARLSSHCRKAWGSDIVTIRIETFASRAEALIAEANAIHDEHPLHNIVLQSGLSPERAERIRELTRQKRVAIAERDRARHAQERLIVQAVDAGWPLRTIGELAGMSHTAILKIKKRTQDDE